MVNPLLTNIPCIDQPPDPIEQETPDLILTHLVPLQGPWQRKQNKMMGTWI